MTGATKEKRAGRRSWPPGPFQLAPGAGQNRHPFPEELSGSGSQVCRAVNAQVPAAAQPDPLGQEASKARWPRRNYRLSPRVHLRFRGTSTVHYALPPAAAAARPSRGRGTRALSDSIATFGILGRFRKETIGLGLVCRCEGTPPPDDSGRRLQPARWFRHSTGLHSRLDPPRDFFKNAGRLAPHHRNHAVTSLQRFVATFRCDLSVQPYSETRSPSSAYVSWQGSALGKPSVPVANSLQSEPMLAS